MKAFALESDKAADQREQDNVNFFLLNHSHTVPVFNHAHGQGFHDHFKTFETQEEHLESHRSRRAA